MRPVRALVLSSLLVACSDDVGLPDARPAIDAAAPGQISLTWTLSHAGAPQTCASVGATSVSADVVPVGAAFGESTLWSCAGGSGTTGMLAPGRYDLRVSVTGGGTLDGPEYVRNIEVKPGQLTPAGPVAFDVEPTGTLAFRITTPTMGNCTDLAQQGAGITATTIELRDSAGACVPTTFAIAAGATQPAGTYASDCAGASYACIAGDQDITATMVAAGQHTMVMTGRIGAAPCWKRTASFAQRAGGLTSTLNPQTLTLDSMVPGCPMP
ncbi:MAG: hypothetical protein IPH44_06250 [Myxococcales bacterium]|nr:hypothetical protein [Myxococcales bacterium]